MLLPCSETYCKLGICCKSLVAPTGHVGATWRKLKQYVPLSGVNEILCYNNHISSRDVDADF